MRLGFIFGFLLGAIAASLKQARVAEAPSEVVVLPEGPETQGLIPKLKAQASEAVAAAREEASRKEAELWQEFEAARKSRPS